MSKFIRLLTLTLALVCTFISCKKDEDVVYGGKPYSLDGTTWTSSMSEDGEYTSFHFLSGMQYEKRILDKNAILVESEPIGVYRLEMSNGRRLIVFYTNRGSRVNSLFIDYNKGTMQREGDVYWKQ